MDTGGARHPEDSGCLVDGLLESRHPVVCEWCDDFPRIYMDKTEIAPRGTTRVNRVLRGYPLLDVPRYAERFVVPPGVQLRTRLSIGDPGEGREQEEWCRDQCRGQRGFAVMRDV